MFAAVLTVGLAIMIDWLIDWVREPPEATTVAMHTSRYFFIIPHVGLGNQPISLRDNKKNKNTSHRVSGGGKDEVKIMSIDIIKVSGAHSPHHAPLSP